MTWYPHTPRPQHAPIVGEGNYGHPQKVTFTFGAAVDYLSILCLKVPVEICSRVFLLHMWSKKIQKDQTAILYEPINVKKPSVTAIGASVR